MKQRIVIASLAFISLTAMYGRCGEKTRCVEKPCTSACNRMYAPVCGCNNKTYSNSCVAECHGITDYKEGACPDTKEP